MLSTNDQFRAQIEGLLTAGSAKIELDLEMSYDALAVFHLPLQFDC
jgi:hypothetical protein